MLNYRIQLIIIFTFLVLVIQVYKAVGQSVIPSTGGTITNLKGSVSYSIGQTLFTSHQTNSGVVIFGVQQPYEIYELSIENNALEGISLSVFPNPTSKDITLSINGKESQNLSYRLFDISGNVIAEKLIISENTNISSGNLISGIYILNITNERNQIIKSFKIIKAE